MFKIDPEEVWSIIVRDLRGHSSASKKIAEDDEGNSIRIETTSSGSNCVELYVYSATNDEILYSDIIIAHDDCIHTLDLMYETFFKDYDVGEDEDDDDQRGYNINYIGDIEDRDDALFDAAEAFLDVVLDGTTSSLTGKQCDDLEEELIGKVARWLQSKGIEVYHPMYLEDMETGEIEFSEYPYKDLA